MTPTGSTVSLRELLLNAEYRGLLFSGGLSWLGDYLARAAVVVVVYQETGSVSLAAAAFAVNYLPWLFMSLPRALTAADRLSPRIRVVFGNALRCALFLVLLIPGIPVAGTILVLFLIVLGAAPTQAARSSLVPLVLTRDQLAAGTAANATVSQLAQATGYILGATIAVTSGATTVFVLCALLFAIAAAVVLASVRSRPGIAKPSRPERDSPSGFRAVFLGDAVLRSIALLVFVIAAVAVVPEGLAVAWAMQYGTTAASGVAQGLLMASGPTGFFLGGLVLSHAIPPHLRDRLVRPLAVAAPALLVPILFVPSVPLSVGLILLSGLAQGGLLPVLNARFVLALPHGSRARAFGVVQLGLQVSQGGAVLVAGFLAERMSPHAVVGWWSLASTGLVALLAARLPGPAQATDGGMSEDDDGLGPDDRRMPDRSHGGRGRPRRYPRRRSAWRTRPDRHRPGRSARPGGSRTGVERSSRQSPPISVQRTEGAVLVARYEDLWAITRWDESSRSLQPLQVRDRPQRATVGREYSTSAPRRNDSKRRTGDKRPQAVTHGAASAFREGLAGAFSFGIPLHQSSSAGLMDAAVANVADAAHRVGRERSGD